MRSKPNYDTIVFDLGGVLIDWNPDHLFRNLIPNPSRRDRFYQQICTPEWNVRQDAGRSLRDATEKKVQQWPRFEFEIRSYYDRWEEMLKGEIPESVDILARLHRQNGTRILALTNWSSETFPIVLERFSFLEWFDGIVVSGEEGVTKPDPAIYEILIERHRVVPSRAIFIDDQPWNVETARELGMHGIHFQSPLQLEQELSRIGVMQA